jgi:hypothetical protein
MSQWVTPLGIQTEPPDDVGGSRTEVALSNDLAFYCRRNLPTRSASRQASAPEPIAYLAVATPG